MPSLRSHLFRVFAHMASAQMDKRSLPRLRTLMGMGSDRPLLPARTTLQRAQANGVPVEWIVPQGAGPSVIFYLHGGGWTLGWYNSHRWFVAHLGQAAASRVLAVDYRLAPEHPYPAALEDCLTAYRWLLQQGTAPQQMVIAGDSAGGNLTLATLLALRQAGDPLPAAAVCISAMTDLAATGASFYTQRDPMVSAPFALTMARHYAAGQDLRTPLLSPHYADLTGLPPLLIHVGEHEILFSDATRLADQARAAGVSAHLTVWPAMWHVWHLFVPFLPEAQQAVAAIGVFVRKCVRNRIA